MVATATPMAGESEAAIDGDRSFLANKEPKALAIASKGVETSKDFTALMSALMGDLLEGTIDPSVGNAVVNAGGKMLKVVELRLRYGARATAPDMVLIG